MRPGIQDGRRPRLGRDGHRRPEQDLHHGDEDDERRHLHLVHLDLLAQVLGRAAHHEAGDEHGDDGEHQDAVEPTTHASEDDLTQLDEDQRDHAAQRGVGVVHGVHRAVGGGGGGGGPSGRHPHAEPVLLALHVAAGLRRRAGRDRVQVGSGGRLLGHAVGLECVGGHHQTHKDHHHDREHGPTLPRIAHHLPEGVGESRWDEEDGEQFEEVGERGGVLERVGGVGVEEAPTVGAELLDGTCEAAGPSARLWPATAAPLLSVVDCRSVACWVSWKVCTTPCDISTMAKTIDRGSRM